MQSVFLYRFFDEAKLFSAFYLAIEPARFAQIAPAFYFVVFHFSKYTLVNYQAWISLAKIPYFLRSAQTHRRQSAATVAGVALARGRSLFFLADRPPTTRQCRDAASFAAAKQWFAAAKRWFAPTKRWFAATKRSLVAVFSIHYQTIQVHKSQRLQGRLQPFPRRRRRLSSPILCPRS